MRSVVVLATAVALAVFSVSAAERTVCKDLKPGDFVRVECRWRNVDVPPTASACPYIEAADASGRAVYRNRASSLWRRGAETVRGQALKGFQTMRGQALKGFRISCVLS